MTVEIDTSWELVAGLEVHVQLATQTKMFCGCATSFGAAPNSHVCPVCLGHPGALPTVNREAIRKAITAGLALNCTIVSPTHFDRKNYFYPDLPKGYQISQLDSPICGTGYLDIEIDGESTRIGITRAHLEEDAGKSTHATDAPVSRIDLNRTGTPLLEIVTEPDFRTPQQAYAFLSELKQRLQYAGVSDCDMERGSLRCDVNLSLRGAGTSELGTKVEIKNLNSFRFVVKAMEWEFKRQKALLDAGTGVAGETRLWQEDREETILMRSKEDADDYRYFPEPDIPPIQINDSWIAERRSALPEMPGARRARWISEYGISSQDAGVLSADVDLAVFFERCAAAVGDGKEASNWIQSELAREANERGRSIPDVGITPETLAELITYSRDGRLNRAGVRELLAAHLADGTPLAQIIDDRGLAQVSDADAIDAWVAKAIESHPDAVAEFRAGNEKTLQFLMGQVMRLSNGQANPATVLDLLKRQLS